MKKVWRILNIYTTMILIMALGSFAMLLIDVRAFIVACTVSIVCVIIALAENFRMKNKIGRYLDALSRELAGGRSKAIKEANLPILITTDSGEIVWYNEALNSFYAEASSLVSKNFADIAGEDIYEEFNTVGHAELTLGDSIFRMHRIGTETGGKRIYAYLLFDITTHRKLRREYRESRPVIALLDIDNFEEITRGARDSDAAAAKNAIHNAIEKWAADTKGIIRRVYGDRYMMILDERDLAKLSADKFRILKSVKDIQVGEYSPTLSIGVGRQAADFSGCEELAVQALEMAQSRGGDQAAIKSQSGEFTFFGGYGAAPEKHTKSRARVVASAIGELMKGADNVVVMGHRYADLDCLGSVYGLYRMAQSFGKETFVAMNESSNMAGALLTRIGNMNPDFRVYTAEEIKPRITKNTLLVLSDVHRAQLTEYPELLSDISSVVVVDHHRKAVDCIDNALIFYHETASSSASEMVTELLQYSGGRIVGQTEAEGLLAGIMLDSRNFVMNTGSRTFEAAAYLRNRGADPIAVKRLFSGSMEGYKRRATIVATAQIYGNMAIAVDTGRDRDTRLATAQAADELLGISDVAASFVLCHTEDGRINISARSLGGVNVQLIMESLGGGGHRTMAACQLEGVGFEGAVARLKEALDTYRKNLVK